MFNLTTTSYKKSCHLILAVSSLFIATKATATEQISTIQLCVDFNKASSPHKKDAILQTLEKRAQLSEKDYKLIPQKAIENGMTRCGMYMSIGTPNSYKTKQLRPMIYKTVHIYPKHYVVTQAGMVVNVMPREAGKLPPKLVHEPPKVVSSPTLR